MKANPGILFPIILLAAGGCLEQEASRKSMSTDEGSMPGERQITRGPGGRILTNTRVWSPDGQWIVYDVRSDLAGERFDGDRIELAHVTSGEVKVIYQAHSGARCGVATFHPSEPKVAFILGPEYPTPDWQYNAYHRQGVVVDVRRPGVAENLDARDLVAPYTPGALRGGSHVHVWDGAGQWVSFTYEDAVLASNNEEGAGTEINLRNVGVSIPGRPVEPLHSHPRNHRGSHFSVIVTRTVAHPKPGSDEIQRAFEEGWIGTNGYIREDGSRQKHALAFQGNVVTAQRQAISEVFIADLPEDCTVAGAGPLAGTSTQRAFPPKGVVQRRLTFTTDRKFPGLQGPRHWLRSAPDGSRVAFLMKDDAGVVQVWTVAPTGGPVSQLTSNNWPIASPVDWSPDGAHLAHIMDGSVCVTDVWSGTTRRLTERLEGVSAPRPEACVFSPDGRKIAFIRAVKEPAGLFNQIFVVPHVE